MAKSFTIRNGKIIVSDEIEITDYALYLKYDWHLYNLESDIRNAKDVRFQDYLKKANELFAEDVSKSRPNKRVDLFGSHSVFYFLYRHTADWVKAARNESQFLKDWLICISGDNIVILLEIIRHSESLKEARENLCETFGIQPASAAKLMSLTLDKITGTEENALKTRYEETLTFLQRVTELEQYEQ